MLNVGNGHVAGVGTHPTEISRDRDRSLRDRVNDSRSSSQEMGTTIILECAALEWVETNRGEF